jgi:hypothetical protein
MLPAPRRQLGLHPQECAVQNQGIEGVNVAFLCILNEGWFVHWEYFITVGIFYHKVNNPALFRLKRK